MRRMIGIFVIVIDNKIIFSITKRRAYMRVRHT
jgi:hypothetical protein